MNDNRSAFLTSVARALGREPRREPAPRPEPVNDYPQTRLSELSLQQRCDAFIDFASSVMQMRCEL
ncbi:TPA: lactate utilization protein C, partial [Pluralibacter gergoviae]|nr:lactate utilization protein C [Pluralibacter gergoviae]